MRSATSCSKTLIRSDWRRFWPVTFLYALISFFAMPVAIWNASSYMPVISMVLSEEEIRFTHIYRIVQHIYESLPGFAVLNLFLGVGLAMVLFGYLMKSNSVGLMHALPVSRTRQFFSHFAAGMSMLTAVNLLTFVLSLLMEALLGMVNLVPLLIWLLVTELVGFFFLSFGALCAMATGWLLAVPVIYFGLNFMVMA
jgi:ABC-2 type transport system permease protein